MKTHTPHSIPSSAAAAAIAHVIYLEGGESNDPADNGGHTRFGISASAHPEVDIAALTRKKAEQIYYQHYWSALQCDVYHPAVGFVLFDMGVNQGVSFAAKVLQSWVGATPDGIVGPKTLALAVAMPPSETIQHLTDKRLLRYANLVKYDAFQNKFIVGWLTRAITVRIAASKLLEITT